MFYSRQRTVQAGQRVQNPGKTYSSSTRKQRGNCWEVIWMLLPLVWQRKAKNISGSWLNLPKQEFPSRVYFCSVLAGLHSVLSPAKRKRSLMEANTRVRQVEASVNALLLILYVQYGALSILYPGRKHSDFLQRRRDHGLPFAGWGSDWNRKNAFPPSSLRDGEPCSKFILLQSSWICRCPNPGFHPRFHSNWHIFPIYRELLE